MTAAIVAVAAIMITITDNGADNSRGRASGCDSFAVAMFFC